MKWNREHQSVVSARIREIKKQNPEKYKKIQADWKAKNPDYEARKIERRRGLVFNYYGGLFPHCECCGESHWEFLTIDHINGDGAEHRKQIKGNLYLWLIQNNFPDGFRILCMNCNWSIGMRGYCPHRGD